MNKQSLPKSRALSLRWYAGLFSVALSLAMALVSASPASAAIGTNLLRNWETGRCLDSNGNGDVYTLPCQPGNAYQTWTVDLYRHSDYDEVTFRNNATGRCLYWADGSVRTAPCTSSGDWGHNLSIWRAVGSGWDNVQLTDAGGGSCLDSNRAGNAYMLGCNGGGFQRWRLGF
ncbi:RICIN domain-containing protein [Streptomyces acidiscabies]|uniref:RICIN domain-containing protein n=1 Tax=Streptomyces acidiscabies TaxID=42234 RepID=UPI00067AE583|nr:RICIN domain-containing protein [Streptomyces acidiscabies]